MAKTGKAQIADDGPEQQGLLSEIKAFASQLGFEDGQHNFDDFAPQQSKHKLIGHKRKHANSNGALEEASPTSISVNKRRKAEKQAAASDGKKPGTKSDAAAVSIASPAGPAISNGLAAAIKERTWNSGVGPRPGEGKRSLLDHSGPALWYEAAAALPVLAVAGASEASASQVDGIRQRGDALLDREAALFEADLGRKNGQDARWLQQVRRSGTTSDKVAALTLLLQESAVANLKSLDTLVGWVARNKGGRSVVGQAIDAVREAFATVLLPDRKLKWLTQQPLSALKHSRIGDRRLLFWAVEDALKQRYATFVTALESASKANLEWVKERALRAACELLRLKPEAEAQLLTLVVNKLGDPSRKLASRAGFLLGGVLEEHPAMKAVVVAEVQRFMFRPGLQERARYYAVVFLNQLQLSRHSAHGGSQLAKQLIGVYLTMFQLIISAKVGHAAAAQHAAQERAEAARLARCKAKGKGRGGAKLSKKRAEVDSANPGLRAEEVDAKMLGALVAGVRRAFPFVDEGDVEAVLEEHSPALYRICHTAPLSVSLQVLALLLQLMSSRHNVSDRFYRALYAVMLSPEVVRSSKAPMFVALVFKAMKTDISLKRITAFAKRLLQLSVHAPAPFAAGILFLLSQVLKAKPALWPSILQPEEAAGDVERFKDAVDQYSSPMNTSAEALPQANQEQPSRDAEQGGNGSVAECSWPRHGGYDMQKREPTFCGAEGSCWWELVALQRHVHPSVTAMACTLLKGEAVVYDGDPLRDFALPAFLDKFVRRKQKPKARGNSIMQPLAPLDGATLAASAAAQPGSQAFAALAVDDVQPDAAFFHKFFASSAQRGAAGGTDSRAGDAVTGSAQSDDSEAEIDAVVNEEEEGGGEGPDAVPDGGYDYSQLATALQGGDSDNGSGSDGDLSDVSDVASADDTDKATSEDGINPLQLASPTTSEDDGGSFGEGVDESSDGMISDDSSDGGRGNRNGDFASADAWASKISHAEEVEQQERDAVAAGEDVAHSRARGADGTRGKKGSRGSRNCSQHSHLTETNGMTAGAAKQGRGPKILHRQLAFKGRRGRTHGKKSK